jgi:hypothetical protein
MPASGLPTDLLPWIRTYASMISDSGEEQFMSKSRPNEAQIISALKQVEAGRTRKTWPVSAV